ncbi:hypothetical protein GTR02_21680, partial [Kineococcus sp. R8]
MRRAVAAITGSAVCVLLLAGYGALDVTDAVPGPLTTTPPPTASPLLADPALGPGVSASVVDAVTGAVLY